MRCVRVSFPAAVLLGLVAPTAAFVPSSHVMVPAHRYNAVCRASSRARCAATPLRMSTVEEAPAAPAAAKLPLSSYTVGQELTGVVHSVQSFGAFVDVGATINGLVHISQLADSFVSKPEEVVSVGQTVTVKVLAIEEDTNKLVLTMRSAPRAAPAQQLDDLSAYVNSLAEDPSRLVEGTVENIIRSGAFVKLADGASGFLHISQLKPRNERVNDVNNVLAVGDKVQARLRTVDPELKRINLSLLPLSTAPTSGKDVSAFVGADPAELRTGTVSAVHDYGVFVKVDGVDGLLHISKVQEGGALTVEGLRERFSIGDEVQVRVLSADAAANRLSLTMLPPRAAAGGGGASSAVSAEELARLSALAGGDEWLEGTIKSTTDYGAFVTLPGSVTGLVHISEMSDARLSAVSDVASAGDAVRVRIIEVQADSGRVRLSMRAPRAGGGGGARASKDVSKYADMDPTTWIEGTVVSFTPFGAFVSLEPGTDGMVHVSEMRGEGGSRVAQPQDVLSEGQTVQVRVLSVDTDAKRISLSMREPRRSDSGRKDLTAVASFDPETFTPGKVTSVTSYGAFVALEEFPGVEGLLHISQLSEGRVEEVEDVVSEGSAINVRIIDVDLDAGKVSLTALAPGSSKSRGGRRSDRDDEEGEGDSFGGAERKKSPRPRFNEYDGNSLNGAGEPSGEADWQKYLQQYFVKKESQ